MSAFLIREASRKLEAILPVNRGLRRCLFHEQLTLHQNPVAWIGAEVGVDTGLLRSDEAEDLDGLRGQKFRGNDDAFVLGNEVLLGTCGGRR